MNKLLVILIVILVLFFAFVGLSRFNNQTGSKQCTINEDCIAYGETGDCNCGCYNEEDTPWLRSPIFPLNLVMGCHCAAPKDCECIEGKCRSKTIQVYE